MNTPESVLKLMAVIENVVCVKPTIKSIQPNEDCGFVARLHVSYGAVRDFPDPAHTIIIVWGDKSIDIHYNRSVGQYIPKRGVFDYQRIAKRVKRHLDTEWERAWEVSDRLINLEQQRITLQNQFQLPSNVEIDAVGEKYRISALLSESAVRALAEILKPL